MSFQDAIQQEIAPGVGDLQALKLRMNLLEAEFRHTQPDETTKFYLLQIELEKVYKAFMECLIHRQQSKLIEVQ